MNPGLVLSCLWLQVTPFPQVFIRLSFFFFFGSSKWKNRLRIQGWELYSFFRVTTNDRRLGSLKQQKRILSQFQRQSPNSGCLEDCTPFPGSRGGSFLTSSSFWWLLLWKHHSSLCSQPLSAFLQVVRPPALFFHKDTSHGIEYPPRGLQGDPPSPS